LNYAGFVSFVSTISGTRKKMRYCLRTFSIYIISYGSEKANKRDL
jgi:hypothetical protein